MAPAPAINPPIATPPVVSAGLPPEPDWENCKSQLSLWRKFASSRATEHIESVVLRETGNTLIGIPTTILTTVVGTAVFASYQQQSPSAGVAGWLAIVSILAAVMTAVQSFFRFSERAVRHQTQANLAHSICADVDLLLVCPPKPEDLRSTMERMKAQVALLGLEGSAMKSLETKS
jgi:hypothetical protein